MKNLLRYIFFIVLFCPFIIGAKNNGSAGDASQDSFQSKYLLNNNNIAASTFSNNPALNSTQVLSLSSTNFGLSGPLTLGAQYSHDYGYMLTGQWNQLLTSMTALNIAFDLGNNQKRISGTIGQAFSTSHRIKFTAERLWQNLNFDFDSGTVNQTIGQNAFGFTYEYLISKGFVHDFNFNATYSKADSKDLGPIDFFDDNNVLWSNYRNIAGGTDKSVSVGIDLQPYKTNTLGLQINYDELRYNPKYDFSVNNSRGFGATVNFQQLITDHIKIKLAASHRIPYQKYDSEIDVLLPAHVGDRLELGLIGSRIIGGDGLPNDYRLGVNLRYSLDSAGKNGIEKYSLDSSLFDDDLAHWTAQPAVHMEQVLAVKDQKTVQATTADPIIEIQAIDLAVGIPCNVPLNILPGYGRIKQIVSGVLSRYGTLNFQLDPTATKVSLTGIPNYPKPPANLAAKKGGTSFPIDVTVTNSADRVTKSQFYINLLDGVPIIEKIEDQQYRVTDVVLFDLKKYVSLAHDTDHLTSINVDSASLAALRAYGLAFNFHPSNDDKSWELSLDSNKQPLTKASLTSIPVTFSVTSLAGTSKLATFNVYIKALPGPVPVVKNITSDKGYPGVDISAGAKITGKNFDAVGGITAKLVFGNSIPIPLEVTHVTATEISLSKIAIPLNALHGKWSVQVTNNKTGLTGSNDIFTVEKLTKVLVTPVGHPIKVGEQLQFTATGIYEDGAQHDLTKQIQWQSSETTVATIDNDQRKGLVSGVGVGQTIIKATAVAEQSVIGETSLTVESATPAPIVKAMTPSQGYVGVKVQGAANQGVTIQGQNFDTQGVTAKLTNGNQIIPIDVIKVTSNEITLADFDIPFTTNSGGWYVEIINNNGGSDGKQLFTVHALQKLMIEPIDAKINVNEQKQFTVTGKYDDGTPHTPTGVKWDSSDQKVATIDNDGKATGHTIGTTIIKATADAQPSMSAETKLSILPGKPVINVIPDQSYTLGQEVNVDLTQYIDLKGATNFTEFTAPNLQDYGLSISLNEDKTKLTLSGTTTKVVPSLAVALDVSTIGGKSNQQTFNLTIVSLPAPTVTSIHPNSAASGTTIDIDYLDGTGFADGATVQLYNSTTHTYIPATNKPTVNPEHTQLTNFKFDIPYGTAPGVWDVVVTNPDGQPGTLQAGFTITSPYISKLIPPEGSSVGGYTINIEGTNLPVDKDVQVKFGDDQHIVTGHVGYRWIISTPVPAHPTGVVNVTVIYPAGYESNALPFTYKGVTVASMTSAQGRPGETISNAAIAGTNFDPNGVTITLTNGSQTINVPASAVTATSIQCGNFDIPLNASHGNWKLTVKNTASGEFGELTNAFSTAQLTGLTIAPKAPAPISINGTQQFNATATYTDAPSLDITNKVTWNSSDESVAKITQPGGLATGKAKGITTIAATVDVEAGTHFSDTAPLSVLGPAPSVSLVTPADGSIDGGTPVTVTGTGFVDGATVTFDAMPATNVKWLSATSITCNTPAHAVGPVNVKVTNSDTQFGTLNDGFTYKYAVTSYVTGTGGTISPLGPQLIASGGNITFTITPNSGYAIAQLLIDNTPQVVTKSYTFANVTANHTINVSFKQITSITVTPASITLPIGSAQQYKAVAVFSDSSQSDVTNEAAWSSSKTSVATINSDTGLATSVAAGTTSIKATLGKSGAASLTVSPLPAPTSISPAEGVIEGGTQVTISGNNFVDNATVSFGGSAWVNPTSVKQNKIVCITPAHDGGTVDVQVKNPDGGIGTLSNGFVYKYTLTSSVIGSGGSISPAGSITVAKNSSQTYTITPDSGYMVSQVLVNGNPVATTTSYTFANITANQTIQVAFKQASTLSTITLTPVMQPFGINKTQQFTATGTFSDGFKADITSQITNWTSWQPQIATVDSHGLVTGISPGIVRIVATFGSITGSEATVVAPNPTITSISPQSGPASGGTRVIISGSGFALGVPLITKVMFGSTVLPSSQWTVNKDGTVSVNSPQGTLGNVVDIVVENANGQSAVVQADKFTYYEPISATLTCPTLEQINSQQPPYYTHDSSGREYKWKMIYPEQIGGTTIGYFKMFYTHQEGYNSYVVCSYNYKVGEYSAQDAFFLISGIDQTGTPIPPPPDEKHPFLNISQDACFVPQSGSTLLDNHYCTYMIK